MVKYKKKDPFVKKDDPRNNYTEIIPIDELKDEEEDEKDKNSIYNIMLAFTVSIGIILIIAAIKAIVFAHTIIEEIKLWS